MCIFLYKSTYNKIYQIIKGKPSPQAFNFTRTSSTSRFGDFPSLLQDKPSPYHHSSSPHNNGVYGSSSTTHTSPRFPPITSFGQLDANNVYNSGGDNNHQMNGGSSTTSAASGNASGGGLQGVYANGNVNTLAGGYNNDSSSNLGTRETGIIEKLLVSTFYESFFFFCSWWLCLFISALVRIHTVLRTSSSFVLSLQSVQRYHWTFENRRPSRIRNDLWQTYW